VFNIPDGTEQRQTAGRVNVSLRFASEQYALLGDGTGRLLLLDTGDRQNKIAQWKVLFFFFNHCVPLSGNAITFKIFWAKYFEVQI
jgi:hypothetical protein